MFRYRFTESKIKQAKEFIKTEKGTQPSFLKKFKGTIKKNKLYLDDKLVIPPKEVDAFLRKKILSGNVPLSRDGLYYFLSKTYAGVTRGAIFKFLKAQKMIRKTDKMQPNTKRTKRKVKRKGQIAYDLIEINWKDLGFVPTEIKAYEKRLIASKDDYDPNDPHGKKKLKIPVKAAYMWSSVDKITGLMYVEFAVNKSRKIITPIAKKAFQYFAKQFKIPMSKLVIYSDKGKEFDFAKYKSWGMRHVQLAREPLIENKNAQFQSALYRI